MALGLEVKARATAGEVLVMRADVLVSILAARMRLLRRSAGSAPAAGGGGGMRDGETRRNADGSVTRQIGSLDSLRAFLGGNGGGGGGGKVG